MVSRLLKDGLMWYNSLVIDQGSILKKRLLKMKVKLYSNPKGTGWLGWIDNCKNQVVAFIRLDGSLVFDW